MKSSTLAKDQSFKTFINGVWKDHPIFSMILGICSALAISNKVENAIAMGAGVTFVLLATGLLVALLRRLIPTRVRMITYMIVVATFVIIVDRVLKALFPDISQAIGPYVGLI
ncbi:MAG: NADH:ubiquinone reductase (Na(+)-transporting) subunit D, partial [Spirochaetales bacterium]|nr:NADH:ubiquinone reductase (Na(+)-transporting) subunit D [Spirochaetales bacterium]